MRAIPQPLQDGVWPIDQPLPEEKAWQFTHPYLDGPLVIEGRHSPRAMRLAAVIHLEMRHPNVDWFIEMNRIEQIEIPMEGF